MKQQRLLGQLDVLDSLASLIPDHAEPLRERISLLRCELESRDHDIEHALRGCGCNMADITACVICQRELPWPRQHVDTCGGQCFKALLRKQREAP